MDKKEIQLVIEEVARIALEDETMRRQIGHELDLADWYLKRVGAFLEAQLNEEVQG